MQLGTQLSPEPSMRPGGRAPLFPAQPSPTSAFLGPHKPSHSPSAPAGTKKERVCVSLPIVPIYRLKCWQDGCDLVTRFSSSSAPSRTLLPLGPLNPPLLPFPLLPLAQASSTPQHPSSRCPPTSHCSSQHCRGLRHQLVSRLWEWCEQEDNLKTGKTLLPPSSPWAMERLAWG